MATSTLRDFLESSTIHGLAHIATAKSKLGRVGWAGIVVACFSIAVIMITSSYKEWVESPVSTTITTHPITELDFPTVTVCPPRGSNTALNHLMDRVKDVDFTEKDKQALLAIAKEVFLEIPNMKYVRGISALLSIENMRSILSGPTSLPDIDYHQNTITLKSSEPEGSFQTPGFDEAGSSYEVDFFNKPPSFHFVLDFPDNIEEMVGEGSIIVSLETKGRGSVRFQETRLELYGMTTKKMRDAEDFCVTRGGHLASIRSKEDLVEIAEVGDRQLVWLGGERIDAEWQWIDGRPWDFENWDASWNMVEHNCLISNPYSGNTWWSNRCTDGNGYKFICSSERVNATTTESRHESVTLNKSLLWQNPFYIWWTLGEG